MSAAAVSAAAVEPAAAEAVPAATEQKRVAAVGIEIGSRRRVVNLDIARRLTHGSRSAQAAGLRRIRHSGSRSCDRCGSDRNSGGSRTQ